MASTSIIAEVPPDDGREWDCQCARCGSSADHQECTACGGEGYVEEQDDEIGDIEYYRCDVCDGHGSWHSCMSSEAYCVGNPIDGRSYIRRGKIEWFTFD